MLTKGYTYEVLKNFKNAVIKAAKGNLTRKDKKVSKELYDSISGEVEVMPNSFYMQISMLEYGSYQDKGVSGTEKRYNTPFSYKSTSNLLGMEYHTGTFAKWARFRGLQPRLKNGRFGSYKSMGFILANSIKKKGIKPSLFFTKPFEAAFKNLPDELIQEYGLDVDDLMATVLKAQKTK